jgi:hypothetical protein
VHIRFGLPAALPVKIKRAIKKADIISARLEAEQIAGFSKAEADRIFGKIDADVAAEYEIRLRPPSQVRRDYMQRHADLLAQMAI